MVERFEVVMVVVMRGVMIRVVMVMIGVVMVMYDHGSGDDDVVMW